MENLLFLDVPILKHIRVVGMLIASNYFLSSLALYWSRVEEKVALGECRDCKTTSRLPYSCTVVMLLQHSGPRDSLTNLTEQHIHNIHSTL